MKSPDFFEPAADPPTPASAPAWASFQAEPQGRSCLEICQGLACREVGNEELLSSLERLSGLRRNHTAEDGSLSLVAGICQGRCAIGPNVRLNGLAFGVEGPSQAEALLKRALKTARVRARRMPQGGEGDV